MVVAEQEIIPGQRDVVFDESVFVHVVEVEIMSVFVWVGGHGDGGEDSGDSRGEIDGCGECVDGGFFSDAAARMWEDVMVCQGVDHGAWRAHCGTLAGIMI